MSDFNPAYYANVRREIEPLLPDRFGSVLEIGCGEGDTLKWLRDTRPGAEVYGVELHEPLAQRGRDKGLELLGGDIEQDGVPFQRQFDLILCLDVLEHLREPQQVLERLVQQHLAPGGHILSSIPNINHISILSDLLLRDRWTYEDSGILDRTHLRFFTTRSAVELFQGAGLEVRSHQRKIPRRTHRILNVLTFGLLRRFFTYQNLFLAARP